MKKFSLTLISLFVAVYAIPQNAIKTESIGYYKTVIKVSPMTFIKGQPFMLHFERAVSGHSTVELGVAPIIWGPIIGTFNFVPDKFHTGIAIDPEIRWYAKTDHLLNGFFFGFYNSNRFSTWDSSESFDEAIYGNSPPDLKVKSRKLIFGFQIGSERLFGKHFLIDFYSGLGLSTTNTIAEVADSGRFYDELNTVGANFRFNVAFGWAF